MVLDLHADTSFGGVERVQIQRAVTLLDEQTHGLFRVSVAFDFNLAERFMLRELAGQKLLLRIESGADRVARIDLEKKAEVLGWDDRITHHIYLVADRIETEDVFASVTMHELLHEAGLEHTDDPKIPGSYQPDPFAVMSQGISMTAPQLCMHMADVREFCRVAHCSPADLPVCRD